MRCRSPGILGPLLSANRSLHFWLLGSVAARHVSIGLQQPFDPSSHKTKHYHRTSKGPCGMQGSAGAQAWHRVQRLLGHESSSQHRSSLYNTSIRTLEIAPFSWTLLHPHPPWVTVLQVGPAQRLEPQNSCNKTPNEDSRAAEPALCAYSVTWAGSGPSTPIHSESDKS